MTTISKIKVYDEVIDIAAIEAKAHQMRAEVMAGYRRTVVTWVKNLFAGLSSRVAH